jgi:hypothetical protein
MSLETTCLKIVARDSAVHKIATLTATALDESCCWIKLNLPFVIRIDCSVRNIQQLVVCLNLELSDFIAKKMKGLFYSRG